MADSANILLCPVGSAGDVYPFVGLGEALKNRGHRVTVLTSGYFQETVERVGLDFVDVLSKDEFLRLVGNEQVWHPLNGAKTILRMLTADVIRRGYERVAERYEVGNTVVATSCLGLGIRLAHEHLQVPLATIDLQPAVIWSEYETPALFGFSERAPRWLKRLQYWIGERFVLDPNVMPQLNEVRRELQLPAIRQLTRWWHSPQCILGLFPEWYAPPQPDWPVQVQLTNFPMWNERRNEPLPDDVKAFLGDGEPPIAFTPGSGNMFGRQFFAAAAAACQQLGRRGMLFSKFTEHIPANLPAGVQHFRYAPFQTVLPHCCGISHHGGIGTTAQAMEAGIPQLIMPLSHDQPDNARRIQRLGIGDWLPPKKYKPAAVAKKLGKLLAEPQVAASCAAVKQRLTAIQEPYAVPCSVIETLIGRDLADH
jgi:UDP:flavonoid glycosyltransferase YjiC (YdhE family)